MTRRKQNFPKRMKCDEKITSDDPNVDCDDRCSSTNIDSADESINSDDEHFHSDITELPTMVMSSNLVTNPLNLHEENSVSSANSRFSPNPVICDHDDNSSEVLDFSMHRKSACESHCSIYNVVTTNTITCCSTFNHDTPIDLSLSKSMQYTESCTQVNMSAITSQVDSVSTFPVSQPLLWHKRIPATHTNTNILPSSSNQLLPSFSNPSPKLFDHCKNNLITKYSNSKIGESLTPSNSVKTTNQKSSVWQNQWLTHGIEQTRDVLKCVWCKISFNTISELTVHMREARHALPPQSYSNSAGVNVSSSSSFESMSHKENANSLKETVALPRKLVRGQDVWLGRGAEQTRQILKCMWCGQSFKTLDEMTVHMQKTQHYTNIISQEQIISWKSPETKCSSSNLHVNAVLTCKVCDQAFSSLKDLSAHMVKFAHYKEHIMRSISETGNRRRQSKEKRKKSLPVRKLLELERAGSETGKLCESNVKKEYEISMKEHVLNTNLRIPSLNVDFSNSSKLGNSLANEETSSPKPIQMMSTSDILTDQHNISSISLNLSKNKATVSGNESKSVISELQKMIESSLDSSSSSSVRSSTKLSAFRSDGFTIRDHSTNSKIFQNNFIASQTRSMSTDSGSEMSDSRPDESDTTSSSEFDRPLSLVSSAKEKQNVAKSNANVDSSISINKLCSISSPISNSVCFATSNQLLSNNNSTNVNRIVCTPNSKNHRPQTSSPITTESSSISSNPLAALQQLCEKSDSTSHQTTSSTASHESTGAILAFSWACNDAVMSDSIMKCAYCDTPFISKGAYRHHLSKVHFVKDGSISDSLCSRSCSKVRLDSPNAPISGCSTEQGSHSKFVRYTELAKTLSSSKH